MFIKDKEIVHNLLKKYKKSLRDKLGALTLFNSIKTASYA